MLLPNFTPAESSELAIFDYDPSAPPTVTILNTDTEDGVTLYDLTYPSPKGGDVTASLIVPNGDGPFPAMLMQHGLGMVDGQITSHHQPLLLGVDFARAGTVVLMIDALFARPENATREEGPLTLSPQDRDEQIQYMVDLRRGIDLLVGRNDVDATRIAYTGRSYSGAMGALLAGIEPRLKTCILTVADGGLVSHMANAPAAMLEQIPSEVLQAWVDVMTPIEPIRFVDMAKMPLFFQSAKEDRAVPVVAAEAIHQAAPEPKTIKWYDSPHGLTVEQIQDQVAWLAEHIGFNADAFALHHAKMSDSPFHRPGVWHL